MSEFRVICIDDKNRPIVIPTKNWVEKDEDYTVIGVQNMARQKGIFGYILKEVSPPKESGYNSYNAMRFRLEMPRDIEAQKAFEQLMQEVEENEIVYL